MGTVISLFGDEDHQQRVPNLPTLFADETLYSWAGVIHLSNPTPNVLETSMRLYAAPYAALMHDFPSHLGALHRNVGCSIGSPLALALHHSLLGYFLVARPHDEAERILLAVESGGVRDLKMQLGIPASRVGGRHPLKGCRHCFEEQAMTLDRPYWRVAHQLPSVLCCTEHKEMRDIAWDPKTPVHRRGWILPFEGLEREWRKYPLVGDVPFQRLLRLADFSARWAGQEPASFDSMKLALVYRNSLEQRDLVTKGGSLRLSEIVRLVKLHYRGLEGLGELRAIQNSEASWATLVGNVSRSVPRPCHPLKHLLLISALYSTWDEFIAAYEAGPASAIETAPQPDRRLELQVLQRSFGELVSQDGLSVSAAGRHIGITATTAVRWAKLLGLSYKPRAKKYTHQRLEEARVLLRLGEPKAQITQRVGIAPGSVNRLISSEPALGMAWRAARHELARQTNRDQFVRILAKMVGRSLNEIRATPGSGYAWLYRHDRQWLMENLPFLGQVVGQVSVP